MIDPLMRELHAEHEHGLQTHVGNLAGRAMEEIRRLRQALRRYGDRSRMATVEPSELQQVIDRAMTDTHYSE